MHPREKFRQNLLVKFHFMKDLNFLIHELEQKNFGLGFVAVQNIGSLETSSTVEANSRKCL